MPRKLHLLTARQCETLGDGKHADGGGLSLIVRGHSRAWVLRYSGPDGRRREMGLGKLEQVRLRTARDDAEEVRGEVRRGIDPLAKRGALRAAAEAERHRKTTERIAEQTTLRRVLYDYHEKYVEPVFTDKHGKQWLASVVQHIPAKILDKPIALIEAGELLDVLQPLYVELPETARRIRQRLDTVFDHAVLRKVAPTNPAKSIVRALRQKREKGHFRALPYDEVHGLVAKLRDLPGTAARALEFAILTAARTSEVLGMQWGEILPSGEVWTVPAARMKTSVAHTVYLSKAARAVLTKVRGLSKRWVFKSPVGDSPLSNMAMLTLLRRIGADMNTTVHGLCRASFSTWANETNAARREVIEACLAHREADRVAAAYNRAQFTEERRALLAKWAEFIAVEPPKASQRRAT